MKNHNEMPRSKKMMVKLTFYFSIPGENVEKPEFFPHDQSLRWHFLVPPLRLMNTVYAVKFKT